MNAIVRSVTTFAIAMFMVVHIGASDKKEGTARGTNQKIDAMGFIVDVHTFFKAVTKESEGKKVEAEHETVAGQAFANESAVYAFIETPRNNKWLTSAV